MGALGASLVLGVIWGFWHLPKYLPPNDSSLLPWMMIKVLADAVIYTWVFNNTRGSLLLTSILHAAGNTAGVFLPIASTASTAGVGAYITAIALGLVVAVTVVFVAGPARLARAKPLPDAGQAAG
ncbi:MAG: type II CAAX prenyl endopeptidase Rce1 family protein [Anaerolineae bacterium]